MKEDNKGFFSQRTFNIFFSGVFVFIMVMLFKEKLETPEDYLEDVKESRVYVEEILVPSLKTIFNRPILEEGQTNRDNSGLSYALRFSKGDGLDNNIIIKIREDGWLQYREDYQEEGVYLFCKNRYAMKASENRGFIFLRIEYSKVSPCWNFEETLKDDFYQLVE